MKRLLYLILLLPFLASAQPFYKAGSFVIKGKVKNFKEPLFDFGMTTCLDNILSSVKVLPDGSFEQQFPIQNRQDIYLYLNDDAITFSVQDKDTIAFEWDDADFKNTFTIKGNDELRTKELGLQWKLYLLFRQPYMQLSDTLYSGTLTAENKYKLINELYNKNMQAAYDSADFTSDNLFYLATSLYFTYTNILVVHYLTPKFKLKLALDTTRSHRNFDTFNSDVAAYYTRLNEVLFWRIPEYRDFISNYVKSYKPFNDGWLAISEKPFQLLDPTLSEYYLAQTNIAIPSIKDWFITRSIMSGFGYYTFADVEKVYTRAVGTLSSDYLKDTLQKYYTAVKRLKPGNPAPGLTLKNDKGQSVSLSDFKGKVVYIDFWGVSCGPCIYDIENYMPRLHDHYKNKDVVFISICIDARKKEWNEALKKYNLDGVKLIAEGWANHPVCKAYNVSSIPHYILIDRNGKIVNNNAPRASELDLASGKNAIDVLLQ